MTADVQLSSTQQSYSHTNGSKAIIIIDVATVVIGVIIRYVVCEQVQIASNFVCLHALSSANE